MRKALFWMAAALLAALALPATAAVTLTAVASQSGDVAQQTAGGAYNLTFTDGYGFDLLEVAPVQSIESISVTLSVTDGDTAAGNFDFNDLTLALDGFDTGLKLNGFPTDTVLGLTISGAIQNADLIVGALKADGKLRGTIIDKDADGPADDIIAFSNQIDTTLELLVTVPEPAGVLLLAGLALLLRRRRA